MAVFDKIKKIFTKNEKKDKYLKGLGKSRKSFLDNFKNLGLNYTCVNEDFLEELMVVLLQADVGATTAQIIVDRIENRSKKEKIENFDQLSEFVIEEMALYYQELGAGYEEKTNIDGPIVLLMIGVNGAGKTTSIAKLAYKYLNEGKSVMVAAGDTFRAGAIDQLATWASRLNIECIKGIEGGDSAAVMVDACRKAKEKNIDVLICDTAGRLQNKVNLMNELDKIQRVIGREIPNAPHDVFLVIDATTGQNGVFQAEEFSKTGKITGIILTKMDGTAKGGIIFAIRQKLKLPVAYLTLGEQMEDLESFDLDSYLYGLCEGLNKDVD